MLVHRMSGAGAMPVVSAAGLVKTYRVYAKPFDRLKQGLFKSTRYFTEVPSLRSLDLEIRPGEILGIVGRNGSGKSTLLKLLAGIVEPTAGLVERNGSVAALIELGAGFNPALTGRENARLSAILMGLSAEESRLRLPAVEAFADIGTFFDYPLSTYSSGMVARVAFAVFATFEPDVLLVDEILAVGDEAFQRKCLARIAELADNGCAIVFVSHSSQLVVEICNRAILLDHGECRLAGEPKDVIREYHRLTIDGVVDAAPALASVDAAAHGRLDPDLVSQSVIRYPENGASISDVRILDVAGAEVNVLNRGEDYCYCYTVAFSETALRCEFGSLIRTVSGVELGGVLHWGGTVPAEIPAGTVLEVRLPFNARLLPGTYFFNAGVRALVDGALTYLHRVVDVYMFKVEAEHELTVSGPIDFSNPEQPQLVAITDVGMA